MQKILTTGLTAVLLLLCGCASQNSNARANENAEKGGSGLARVGIVPFQNQSGSADYDWIGNSLPEATQKYLEKKFSYEPVAEDKIAAALAAELQKSPTLERKNLHSIAEAAGADLLIFGAYSQSKTKKKNIEIESKIFHAGEGLVIGSTTTTNPLDSTIFQAVDKTTGKIAVQINDYAKKSVAAKGIPAPSSPDEKVAIFRDRVSSVAASTAGLLQTIEAHNELIFKIAVSPGGDMLASTGADKRVKLWSTDGSPLHTFDRTERYMRALAFSKDGSILAAGSDAKLIMLWNVKERKQIAILQNRESAIVSLAFDPTGTQLVAGGKDGYITLWQISPEGGTEVTSIRASLGMIRNLAYSPDGSSFVMSDGANSETFFSPKVKVFSSKGELIRELSEESADITALAVSKDSKLIAAAHGNGAIVLWNKQGEFVRTMRAGGLSSSLFTLGFTRDGLIFSGGADSTLKLWTKDGQLMRIMTIYEHAVSAFLGGAVIYAAAADPRTPKLYSGMSDGKLRIWDIH